MLCREHLLCREPSAAGPACAQPPASGGEVRRGWSHPLPTEVQNFVSLLHPSRAAAGGTCRRNAEGQLCFARCPFFSGVSQVLYFLRLGLFFLSCVGDKKDVSLPTPLLHCYKITQQSTVVAGKDKCNFATSAL